MKTFPSDHARQLVRLAQHYAAEGGVDFVAEQAGLKPEYLQQVIDGRLLPTRKKDGGRSPRRLGNTSARKIELMLSLGGGWLERDEEVPSTAFAPPLRTITPARSLASINEGAPRYLGRPGPADVTGAVAMMITGLDIATRRAVVGLLSGLAEDPKSAPRVASQIESLLQTTKVSTA
jgi:hypothetical protein